MMNTVVGKDHGRRVCLLYKRILRLHKGLPADVRAIGDWYVKEEFRRHKTAGPQETVLFMQEWIVREI